MPPDVLTLSPQLSKMERRHAQLELLGLSPPLLKDNKMDQKQAQAQQITEAALPTTQQPYNGPSCVFPTFNHPFPCFQGENQLMLATPASKGILFQRPHKTGSTTMVGIVLRLAHNRAAWNEKCKHRTMHEIARKLKYGKQDRTKSFLFSIIRDPTTRSLSEFFHFHVAGYLKEPTDENFRSFARGANFNYYLKELTTRNYSNVAAGGNSQAQNDLEFAKSKGYNTIQELNLAKLSGKPGKTRLLERQRVAFTEFGPNYDANQIVQDILDDYDFIAIMERMDESLVVFQMLLGLTTKEILYTRARSSGSFSNGWNGRPCFYIMKSFLTDGMKKFFASEEWQQTIANDLLVFQAANKSLDRAIEALGKAEFDEKLAALQRGLLRAKENCSNNRIRTMCDAGGTPIPVQKRTCYIWAEGCDHACIDELEDL